MKLSKVHPFTRSGRTFSPLSLFSHKHWYSTNLGIASIVIVLVAAAGVMIQIAQKRKRSDETEMLDGAVKAISEGHLNKAKRLIQSTLKLYPKSHNALYLRGVLELEEFNFKAAKDSFTSAVEENPNSGEYFLGLGIALYHLGQLQDSLTSLRRAQNMLSKDEFTDYLERSGLRGLYDFINPEAVEEAAYVKN